MRFGSRQWERTLGTASVGLLLLATWWFYPKDPRPSDLAPAVRVVLVDASASARRLRPAWSKWARRRLAEEARFAKAASEEVAVVVYADEVRRVLGPAPPQALLDALQGRGSSPLVPSDGAGSDGASRLVGALQVAEGLVLNEKRVPGRVVLLGADPASDGDPNDLLARLARRVRLEWRPLPEPELSDLALLDLRLPPTIEVGAPLVAEFTLSYTSKAGQAQAGFLELEIFEAGALRFLRLPLDCSLLKGPQRLSVSLGPALVGLTRVNASVRLEGSRDPIPENDSATAVTSSRDSRVIGLLTNRDSNPTTSLASGLPSSIAGSLPAGFPGGLERVDLQIGQLPQILPRLDALVAVDMSLRELEQELTPGLLEAFIRGGGGWMSTGGWRFLRGWSREDAERGLGALLPLGPAQPEGDPRDVILLLDGSQSMEGEPFEAVRAAAIELVEAAPPSDRVTLRFFTATLKEPVVLKERYASLQGQAAGRAAAKSLLSRTVPRGNTHLMGSLEALLDQRDPGGPPALVLLLTDGREMESPVRPYGERAAELRARFLSARVRLVPIGVGERIEKSILKMLVPTGQPVTVVEDYEDLGALFRREVGGNWVEAKAGQALPLTYCGTPEGLAQELFGGQSPPPVQRHLRAELRPGAEAIWCAEQGLPILGVERLGRGRVAALATALDSDWASLWVDPAPGASSATGWQILEPLLRWLARRPPAPTEHTPSAFLDGDRIVVRGLPACDSPRLKAKLGRDQGSIDLELGPVVQSSRAGLDALVERVGRLDAEQREWLMGTESSGTASLLVDLPMQGKSTQTLPIALALGPAPEFVDGGWKPDRNLFAALVEPDLRGESGLFGDESPSDLFQGKRQRSGAVALLALGSGLLALWVFLGLRFDRNGITK